MAGHRGRGARRCRCPCLQAGEAEAERIEPFEAYEQGVTDTPSVPQASCARQKPLGPPSVACQTLGQRLSWIEGLGRPG